MRQARKKHLFGRLWQMGGMVLFLTFVAGGLWWGQQHLLHLSYFQVSDISVRGNARVSTEEILTRLDLKAPVSVLRLGLERLAGSITTHPWIRSASLRRQLPLGLIITVEERQPAALLVTGKTYLVSADAVVLEEVKEEPPRALPRFRTGWRAEYRAGEHLSDPRLLGGFRLLEALQGAALLQGERVEEVTVEADGNYILHLASGRAILRLGPVEPLPQLSRLNFTLRHRGQELDSFAYIDLRFPGRVILKPLEKGG
ncbi:MAG: cell division protein FtsQ/DivIB [Candidatus Methylomirabilales bacterium]